MSDKKKTINVDGLSDVSIKAFQKGVDVCRGGKGIWMMDDEAYNERMNKSFNRGLYRYVYCIGLLGSLCCERRQNQGQFH